MRCLGRIGCAAVVVLIAVAAWLTRDRWLEILHVSPAPPPSGPQWEGLTAAGAERTRQALLRLNEPSGPVFTNLSGADVASYVFRALAKQLPPSADSVEATVIGDRLAIRASVKLSDLGGPGALGPLAGFLGNRERMQFSGTFSVLQPGLGEYEVKEIRLHDIAVPTTAIPRVLRQIERGPRPNGLSADGLPLVLPRSLGDIRIARGRVTLYKTMPNTPS